MGELGQAWTAAVAALGGDPERARPAAEDAERRYGAPSRRYHGTAHVLKVLRGVAALAPSVGLDGQERACVDAAACAHDVIYDGVPGEDERRSADWARESLRAAGVLAGPAGRVHALVLATADHSAAPGDDAAAVLLDADLAILGSSPLHYRSYVAAVRAEYSHLDDAAWRSGRTAVLTALAAREALFATHEARALWDAPARLNMLREIESLARP